MDQGTVSFPGLEQNIGGEMELSRGVTPSSCRIWLPARPALGRQVGSLIFNYPGVSIAFKNAAIAPGTLRALMSRQGFIWTVVIRDRRWKWRYPTISGEYNVRRCDGSVLSDTKRTLEDLVYLLCDALGEYPTSVDVPTGIYPYVNWNNVRAANQLAHLLERHGCILSLGYDNQVRIHRMSVGANLPADNAINVNYSYAHAIVPSAVRAYGSPTAFQAKLKLEPVGLDVDGSIKHIDQLSYVPSGGWASQWYTSFAGVAPDYRYLAFASVYRWYRVKANEISIPGVNFAVDELEQIELQQQSAQSSETDRILCLPPLVKGQFWGLSDHPSNFTTNVPYSASFKINSEERLVEFEYPVIKWDGSYPAPADLYLVTAVYVRDKDGEYVSEYAESSVSPSVAVTEPRVDRHLHIRRSRIVDSVRGDGSVQDNGAAVQAELQSIADALSATYTNEAALDVWYAGLREIRPDGAIAQVRWSVGNGKAATTRASRHAEFAVFAPDYQDRRRRERLTQLAEEILD